MLFASCARMSQIAPAQFYSKAARDAVAATKQAPNVVVDDSKSEQLEKEKRIRLEADRKRKQAEAKRLQAQQAEEERIQHALQEQKQRKAEYVAYLKAQLLQQRKSQPATKADDADKPTSVHVVHANRNAAAPLPAVPSTPGSTPAAQPSPRRPQAQPQDNPLEATVPFMNVTAVRPPTAATLSTGTTPLAYPPPHAGPPLTVSKRRNQAFEQAEALVQPAPSRDISYEGDSEEEGDEPDLAPPPPPPPPAAPGPSSSSPLVPHPHPHDTQAQLRREEQEGVAALPDRPALPAGTVPIRRPGARRAHAESAHPHHGPPAHTHPHAQEEEGGMPLLGISAHALPPATRGFLPGEPVLLGSPSAGSGGSGRPPKAPPGRGREEGQWEQQRQAPAPPPDMWEGSSRGSRSEGGSRAARGVVQAVQVARGSGETASSPGPPAASEAGRGSALSRGRREREGGHRVPTRPASVVSRPAQDRDREREGEGGSTVGPVQHGTAWGKGGPVAEALQAKQELLERRKAYEAAVRARSAGRVPGKGRERAGSKERDRGQGDGQLVEPEHGVLTVPTAHGAWAYVPPWPPAAPSPHVPMPPMQPPAPVSHPTPHAMGMRMPMGLPMGLGVPMGVPGMQAGMAPPMQAWPGGQGYGYGYGYGYGGYEGATAGGVLAGVHIQQQQAQRGLQPQSRAPIQQQQPRVPAPAVGAITAEERALQASLAAIDARLASRAESMVARGGAGEQVQQQQAGGGGSPRMPHRQQYAEQADPPVHGASRHTALAPTPSVAPQHMPHGKRLQATKGHAPTPTMAAAVPVVADVVARVRGLVGAAPTGAGAGGAMPLDAQPSVSSLADAIARTKHIVAQARTPSAGPYASYEGSPGPAAPVRIPVPHRPGMGTGMGSGGHRVVLEPDLDFTLGEEEDGTPSMPYAGRGPSPLVPQGLSTTRDIERDIEAWGEEAQAGAGRQARQEVFKKVARAGSARAAHVVPVGQPVPAALIRVPDPAKAKAWLMA